MITIKLLNTRINFNKKSKLNKRYIRFYELITELKTKELPENLVCIINSDIDFINSLSETDRKFVKHLGKIQSKILSLLKKNLKLVAKHYYRNIWIAIGTGVFGIPTGVVFGIITGNMGFIGLGLPIGLLVGMGVGTLLDKKSKEKGKQLDLEIEY